MDAQSAILVGGLDVFIMAILVVFIGAFINRKIPVLSRNSIPDAVTGGILMSIVLSIVTKRYDLQLEFDMRGRDLLLLVFFSTIGLSAKFKALLEGGRALAILLGIAIVFLILQDFVGILLAELMGAHPAYGLFVGSISLAGGHGTAIAWGAEAEKAGLEGAQVLGLTFATFGLIMGGLIGGPIASRLIEKNKLKSSVASLKDTASANTPNLIKPVSVNEILSTLLVIAISIAVGDWINRFLFDSGVLLPGFLTAMLVAIIITNGSEYTKFTINQRTVSIVGDVSLQVFLAMSLMAIQFMAIQGAFLKLIILLACQVTVMTLFTMWIVYRVMGRNYDSAVMASGFAGLGLGATPVAIGNMNAITQKYGPSPKAFLVVPLVGAFFIDIANALILKFYLSLPRMEAILG